MAVGRVAASLGVDRSEAVIDLKKRRFSLERTGLGDWRNAFQDQELVTVQVPLNVVRRQMVWFMGEDANQRANCIILVHWSWVDERRPGELGEAEECLRAFRSTHPVHIHG